MTSVGNTTYEELLEKTDGDIALYNDAMDRLQKKLNIEIKSQGEFEEDRKLVDEIIADVRNRGREKDVMISSISPEVVRYINEQYPNFPTGQIRWLTSSTYLHFEALTEDLYKDMIETRADFLMLHVSNLHNIEDLLKLKPGDKSIIFWNFDDRMYLIHKDPGDRLWGTSVFAETWQNFLFWTH